MAVIFVATFVGCSDDDEGIYFTQDEIVGDINTGKYINIGNRLNVYANYGGRVNVHGQSGDIKATSTDEKVATVTVDNRQYNDGHVSMTIHGVSNGQTDIIVSDANGNTATLTVDVTTLERMKYKRTASVVNVAGVSDAEAETIKADVLEQHANESRYEVELVPSSGYSLERAAKLYVYDASDKLLYEMNGRKVFEGGTYEFYKTIGDATYTYSFMFGGDYMEIDLSPEYRAKYQNESLRVELTLSVEKVE